MNPSPMHRTRFALLLPLALLLAVSTSSSAEKATQQPKAAPPPAAPTPAEADTKEGAAKPEPPTPVERTIALMERQRELLQGRIRRYRQLITVDPAAMQLLSDLPRGGDEEAMIKEVRACTGRLQKTVSELQQWRERYPPSQSRGALAEVVVKAEHYATERRYQKQIENDAVAIARFSEQVILQHILQLTRREQEITALLSQLQRLQVGTEGGDTVADGQSIDGDFEYFEVQREAPLEQVSALPAVYADGEMWETIADANRDKLPYATASTVVPAGTVLIIPRIAAMRTYGFGDE